MSEKRKVKSCEPQSEEKNGKEGNVIKKNYYFCNVNEFVKDGGFPCLLRCFIGSATDILRVFYESATDFYG